MNALATVDDARRVVCSLDQLERSRGGTLAEARLRVARKLRIGRGSYENLIRGRIKRLDAWLRDRIQALLIRELEAEIARLTHELEMARQSGVHFASQHVGEIETHLTAARSLIEEATNGGKS